MDWELFETPRVAQSEIDSAKIILRLSSELKEKEAQIANMQAQIEEAAQKAAKTKELEYETLMKIREEKFSRKEEEISRLLIEKENELWNRYKKILEETTNRYRRDVSAEKEKLELILKEKEEELKNYKEK